MASRPFSYGSPSPSAPENLMNVANAAIHLESLKKEDGIAGHWKTEYGKKLDRELQQKLAARPRTSPAPTAFRLPSSAAVVRTSFGWDVPQLEGRIISNHTDLLRAVKRENRHRHPQHNKSYPFGVPVPPGYAHLPLMRHPKQKIPAHYGRTLHTAIVTGVDNRSR